MSSSPHPTDQPAPAEAGTPPKQAKRSRRWWLGLPVLAILAIAFLPSLLGSRWVYQKLVDRLAIEGFRLEIQSAEIGWLRPIAFRGIRIEQIDAPKPVGDAAASKRLDLLSIDAVESNRSLIGYLLGGRDLGKITIVQPRVDIELLEDSSNLERLAKTLTEQSPAVSIGSPKTHPRMDLGVSIQGMSVAVLPGDREISLLVVPPFDVDLQYRSMDGRARIEVAPTKILDHVVITQELVRLGLGRAIPLLAKSAWFDGSVSLETQGCEILLDEPKQSTGQATLTLHEVRSGPSEPLVMNVLDMVASFRKTDPVYELVFIDGSKIDVSAREGRIFHRGVEVGFPKIDPRLQLTSEGSVGMEDKSLDLLVGVPVPLEQLARRESVQGLGVPQLSLPVRGTLDQPVVDWQSLRSESSDLLALVSAALGEDAPGAAAAIGALGAVASGQADEAIGAAVDALRELRRTRLERRARAAEESLPDELQPINNPEDRSSPRRPLRDGLRNRRR